MNSTTFADDLPGEICEVVSNFRWSHSGAMLSLAATVVVCYDHALTFGREVNYMWKPRFSSAVILFHVVRYAGIVEALVVAYNTVATVDATQSSLRILILDIFAILSSLHIAVGAAVFSALRARAISGHKVRVFAITLALNLLYPLGYIATLAFYAPVFVRLFYHAGAQLVPVGIAIRWNIGTRICAVVADAAVLVVTWMYARPTSVQQALYLLSPRVREAPISRLSDVIVTNGTLYFGTLLTVNVVAAALSGISQLMSPLSLWVSGLTCVLTSRFILDLQEANERLGCMDSSDTWGIHITTTTSSDAPGLLDETSFGNQDASENAAASPASREVLHERGNSEGC